MSFGLSVQNTTSYLHYKEKKKDIFYYNSNNTQYIGNFLK